MRRARNHVGRLNPIDRRLHGRVEFLHAEARAREAEPSDCFDHALRQRARIALNGALGVGRQVEPIIEMLHDRGEIVGAQGGRRPPAEMNVGNRHAGGQCGGKNVDLRNQMRDIIGHRRIARDKFHVAAAIPAQALAERYVDIKR